MGTMHYRCETVLRVLQSMAGDVCSENGVGDSASTVRAWPVNPLVADYYVFNIAGNRYRVVAAIHFNTQSQYVRAVLPRRDNDNWRP